MQTKTGLGKLKSLVLDTAKYDLKDLLKVLLEIPARDDDQATPKWKGTFAIQKQFI